MTLYTENTNDSIKKLLELVNEFDKFAEYKISMQKSMVVLSSNSELAKKEIKKMIPFIKATKT
jgi:hypothetical protein